MIGAAKERLPLATSSPAEIGYPADQATVTIRRLVLLYIFMWLLEGVARKWLLTPLQQPLYFLRVPVVVATVVFALGHLRRPWPKVAVATLGFVVAVVTLTGVHVVRGDQSLSQAVLGTRLWLEAVLMPLAAAPWLRWDVTIAASRVLAWFAFPIAGLAVAQVASPPTAWINRLLAADGSDNFVNAGQAVRATSVFSSSAGHAAYLVLLFGVIVALCMSAAASQRDRFLAAALVPVFPILAFTSGSRSVIFGCAVVVIVVIPMLTLARPRALAAFVAVAAVATWIMWQATTVVASGAIAGLTARFSGDGAVAEPSGRVLNAFVGWIDFVPYTTPLGSGLGSTARGLRPDGLAGQTEAEWGQWVVQLGPALCVCALALRILACVGLVVAAVRAAAAGRPELGVYVAAGLWTWLVGAVTSQGSVNGAAVVGLLLALGALRQRTVS